MNNRLSKQDKLRTFPAMSETFLLFPLVMDVTNGL